MTTRTDALLSQQETGKITASIANPCYDRLSPGVREENRLRLDMFLGQRFCFVPRVPALEAIEIREHHGLKPALMDDEGQHWVEEHVDLRFLSCNVR
ncbi:hypothetical protein [Rhodoplanes sp. Z2-YC6860]|uniref:hypothetical protein n=1 Tax=Rhodoplanes sp. Z2-YC6860 TaxID=674703 RepID=UPI0012EED549|nr:hypothetical protein [Rhodoplanes sp. Z2-YC6860]